MPTDFTGIATTNKREYIPENISFINEELNTLPIEQRAAILGSIIEESGGKPLAKNNSGAYQGLLQWGADRYIPQSTDKGKELRNQTQYILNTINNTSDGVSWTHGGNGSGYNTQKEAHDAFNNDDNTFADKFKAFSYGYVRPQGKGDSYQNRLKVGRQVLNRLVVNEKLSKPQPRKWTPMPFGNKPYVSKFKYGDGGNMDYPSWDNLSLSDKAEMMKVAIANGITTLPEIRNAYNEFAKGGSMNTQGSYKPSATIKKRITDWEGSSMKTNRSFEDEAMDFNNVIPAEIRSKLSQQQKDALYSYGYNVGMGRLKQRVLPTLTAYTEGRASKEDVQRAMWASRDNELRGLTNRRNAEREMFGGNYRTKFTGTGKLGIHIDPSDYTLPQEYFDSFNSQISLPQLQMPTGNDVDPETLYKPPVLDNTLFEKPVVTNDDVAIPSNPRQERMDRLQSINTIMGLFGQRVPMLELIGNSQFNPLSYIGQIYNS